MTIESRLARGDNPEDVAKLFGIPVEEAIEWQKELMPKKKPVKKAAKSKT